MIPPEADLAQALDEGSGERAQVGAPDLQASPLFEGNYELTLIREKPKTAMTPRSPRIRGFDLPTARRKDTLLGPSRVSFISPQWASGLGVLGALAGGNFGLGLTLPRHAARRPRIRLASSGRRFWRAILRS